MFLRSFQSAGVAALVLSMGVLQAGRSTAQERDGEALSMVTDAMDAYANLELDKAKEILENALALRDELTPETLAKIHSSLGILFVSGFSDSPAGQNHFIRAACLAPESTVDPLFSTPEIDLLFTQGKELATPDKCEELGVVIPGEEPGVTPCGAHEPIEQQKRAHEVPFFVAISPELRSQISELVVHYSFDSGAYKPLQMAPKSGGYGAMLECDTHDLRLSDPNEIAYYIEGRAADGTPICGHGTDAMPLVISMESGAEPLPPIGGMTPKECVQCAPWDDACRKKQAEAARGDAGQGQSCMSDLECRPGLICDPDLFVCQGEKEKGKADTEVAGPSRFYASLSGGTGVGFVNKGLTIKKAAFNEGAGDDFDPRRALGERVGTDYATPTGQIVTIDDERAKGVSWSGVPVRLALGYHITEKLSLEVSGRLDVYIVSNVVPISCLDAAGGDTGEMVSGAQSQGNCSFGFGNAEDYTDEELAILGENAISMTPLGGNEARAEMSKEYQFAWLVNARVRYRYLSMGRLAASLFGGVGYGHIQYRVTDTKSDKNYFPLPGMIDIELGLGVAYYFSKHAGIIFDVPFDVLVADGFAFNIDFNLGVTVGF